MPPTNAGLVILNKLKIIYLGFAGRTKEVSIQIVVISKI